MNWDQVAGSWRQAKGRFMSGWGRLSSNRLTRARGKRDQVIGLVQKKYGLMKDAASRKIDRFVSRR
jgi:uncharacterized protein YjbJ (UPF0337 family)